MPQNCALLQPMCRNVPDWAFRFGVGGDFADANVVQQMRIKGFKLATAAPRIDRGHEPGQGLPPGRAGRQDIGAGEGLGEHVAPSNFVMCFDFVF
jgi:hypothetical protein